MQTSMNTTWPVRNPNSGQGLKIARSVQLIDTTLRDGEQAPGVCFTRQAKIAIARALDAAGIDELEVGAPAMGRQACGDIRAIAALGLGCRLSTWCRALEKDLTEAVRCHVSGVHFSFPVSGIHLQALGKSHAWVFSQMALLVRQARNHFDRVTVGAQDATRARTAFLLEFAAAAEAAGVDQLRLADTVGIARPAEVYHLVGLLRKTVAGLKLEFHAHNDLGMATANALIALEAGAQAVSATANGLGERAGNTALEQIAMALHFHPDLACGLKRAALLSLSRLVAQASGRPVPPGQPVVGGQVFAHESGIHCHAMLQDTRAYEPFAPQLAGHGGRRYLLGSHSGAAAIRHLLEQAGIHVSSRQAQALRPLLSRFSKVA